MNRSVMRRLAGEAAGWRVVMALITIATATAFKSNDLPARQSPTSNSLAATD